LWLVEHKNPNKLSGFLALTIKLYSKGAHKPNYFAEAEPAAFQLTPTHVYFQDGIASYSKKNRPNIARTVLNPLYMRIHHLIKLIHTARVYGSVTK
jgi:hypothetical protein